MIWSGPGIDNPPMTTTLCEGHSTVTVFPEDTREVATKPFEAALTQVSGQQRLIVVRPARCGP